MRLLANLNTVYLKTKSSVFTFLGGWTGPENCDANSPKSGGTVTFTGGWTGFENCDGTNLSGRTVTFTGGWTGPINCGN